VGIENEKLKMENGKWGRLYALMTNTWFGCVVCTGGELKMENGKLKMGGVFMC
jgi:hypothetical protein